LGTAEEKLEILQNFLKAGGDLVDMDVERNEEDIIRQIPEGKRLLSYHDFVGNENFRSDLDDILVKMYFLSPVICKFSVAVNNPVSLELFVDFVRNFPSNQNAIFTTMGKFGSEGRKRIKALGKSWGNFVALDANNKTEASQKVLDKI
jgi:3-dehydroquinate dehydratase